MDRLFTYPFSVLANKRIFPSVGAFPADWVLERGVNDPMGFRSNCQRRIFDREERAEAFTLSQELTRHILGVTMILPANRVSPVGAN